MAAQKLEQRRLHMLTKQREQLESRLEALQDEIADLQEDLRKEQDPNRMQAIQEMISVRRATVLRVVPVVIAAKRDTSSRNF